MHASNFHKLKIFIPFVRTMIHSVSLLLVITSAAGMLLSLLRLLLLVKTKSPGLIMTK